MLHDAAFLFEVFQFLIKLNSHVFIGELIHGLANRAVASLSEFFLQNKSVLDKFYWDVRRFHKVLQLVVVVVLPEGRLFDSN